MDFLRPPGTGPIPSSQRDLVLDTLATMTEFCETLQLLCQKSLGEKKVADLDAALVRLVDGVKLLFESLGSASLVLRARQDNQLILWESDAHSLCKDLMECREKQNFDYIHHMLEVYLPENLEHLKRTVIPRLVSQAKHQS